jgi:plastocyanin
MSASRTGSSGAAGMLPLVALVVAIVALVVAAYAVMQPGAAQLPAPAAQEREVVLSSDLLGESNRYHPATVAAFAGDTITFQVTNRGDIPHGFRIEELGIEETVEPGQTAEVAAGVVEAGVYRYYCHLHPAHIGGQLVVYGR